ncbi:hypothetical protein C0J52_05290 [Blattella germanica]|nr:hypothetical protein C0J52_05290 [Blattella germanica]
MSLRPTDPNFEKVLHQWLEEDPDDEIEVGPEFDDSDQDPDFIVPNSNQSATSDSSESDSELVTRSVVIPNKQINENEDVTIPSCSSNLPSTNYVYFGKINLFGIVSPNNKLGKHLHTILYEAYLALLLLLKF